MNKTREQYAGELYIEGFKAARSGGHELSMLAGHLRHMINGTSMYPGPLWQVRAVPPEGSIRKLDRFVDYLLQPARDGLGLPSLYFLKQALEATPKDGERTLALVRSQLALENIDFDAVARRDELKLRGEQAPLAPHGVHRDDNAAPRSQGTSAAYLAARLKRDHPEIARQLANGKFRSVRAAAIAAGILTPPTPFEIILKQLPKLTASERQRLRDMLDAKRDRKVSKKKRPSHDGQLAARLLPEDLLGDTAEQRWQYSVGNMAGDAISLPAFWNKTFGKEWKDFEVPSDLVTLAQQAADTWGQIANELK